MSIENEEEVRAFAESVRDLLAENWGNATAAKRDMGRELHSLASVQEWFELGAFQAVPFAARAMNELGACACPLPIHDAFIVHSIAPSAIAEKVGIGEIIPLIGIDHSPESLYSGASIATHVLDLNFATSTVSLAKIVETTAVPGLASPPWCVLKTELVDQWDVATEILAGAIALWGFFLACRMVGAAERSQVLAVEHAKNRQQFKRVIGSYGAVQQRVAQSAIYLEAAKALVEESLQSLNKAEDADQILHLALATTFIREKAVGVVQASQHTLGAIGYFEEHELPWLFRQVHADSLMLDARTFNNISIAGLLMKNGASLPDFHVDDEAVKLRDEVRTLLAKFRTGPGATDYQLTSLREAAAETGIFTIGWPKDFGGRQASPIAQAVLAEEMKRAGGPVDRAMSAAAMLGHSLIRFGTLEQHASILPFIERGELAFCLGYSESEAGSDLASLTTSAVAQGSSWVINGQKLWTTRANTASHVWLAVRSDPSAQPRHAGISIFLIPMDTPGITINEHVALSGEISCTVFYDDVIVEDSMRVGEVNGGWAVITDALTSERLIMGGVAGTLLRQFEAALGEFRRREGASIDRESAAARRLNSLAASLQAARALVLRASRSELESDIRRISPMAAVFSGDFAEELTVGLLTMLGLRAALGANAPDALRVVQGELESIARLAPMYVIGGGTNDIQRGIIARTLGLPRE